MEPVPDIPDACMFVQGHATIGVFAIVNSLSKFTIAAIVAGMETTNCLITEQEETYVVKELQCGIRDGELHVVVDVQVAVERCESGSGEGEDVVAREMDGTLET